MAKLAAKINIASKEYTDRIREKAYSIREFADVGPEIITEKIIEGQEIELDEVKPGEIITSDLFNRIIRKLNALELKSNAFDDIFKLGPLAEGIHTIIVLSGTLSDEEGLWVDGVHKVSNLEYGVNIIVLDENLEVKIDKKNPTDDDSKEIVGNLKENELLIVIRITNPAGGKVNTAASRVNGIASKFNEIASKMFEGLASVDTNNFIIVSRITGTASLRSNSLLDVSNSAGTPLSAWGIYSIPHKRFLIGGITGNNIRNEGGV